MCGVRRAMRMTVRGLSNRYRKRMGSYHYDVSRVWYEQGLTLVPKTSFLFPPAHRNLVARVHLWPSGGLSQH